MENIHHLYMLKFVIPLNKEILMGTFCLALFVRLRKERCWEMKSKAQLLHTRTIVHFCYYTVVFLVWKLFFTLGIEKQHHKPFIFIVSFFVSGLKGIMSLNFILLVLALFGFCRLLWMAMTFAPLISSGYAHRLVLLSKSQCCLLPRLQRTFAMVGMRLPWMT